MIYLLVSSFGVLGILARLLINEYFLKHYQVSFPLATFTINIVGSFLMGLAFVFGIERQTLSEELRTGIMVGLLGGFTTFSAFSIEIIVLLKEAAYLLAVAYFVASPTLAVIAAYLGVCAGRFLAR